MRAYAKAIQATVAARAIWDPGTDIAPGDYGTIQDGCFFRLGSICELGINPGPPDIAEEQHYELSHSLYFNEDCRATTRIDWTGDQLTSIDWAGGAGLFLGAPKSSILALRELGVVVRSVLASRQWNFRWRLVREVRTLSNGVLVLGASSAGQGRVPLAPNGTDASTLAPMRAAALSGFKLIRMEISGAVFAHTIRLRPWLSQGLAPLDHELWYEDDMDDE